MCFTTLLGFLSTFIAADIFKNLFPMVEFIVVRRSLLARLATVSVLWQRAVNRQPGYRSGKSKGRSPSRYHFPEILESSENPIIFQLFKKSEVDRTLKF